MKQEKICRCNHSRDAHDDRGCLMRGCRCLRFKWDTGRVTAVSKYCQGTPPPDYTPSPDPEPLRW